MPNTRKSASLVEEMIKDPSRALEDPEFWRDHVCRRWLKYVADVHLASPEKAVPLALIGVRLASRVVRQQKRRKVKNRCILARANAVLGFVSPQRSDRAARALARAERLAAKCNDPDVLSDIRWRQAYRLSEIAQREDGSFAPERIREAARVADDAVKTAVGQVAVARAMTVRGLVFIRAGQSERAVTDAREALDLLDSQDHEHEHNAALSVLASALVRGGSEDREEAIRHLEKLRKRIPRRHQVSRARLLWCQALVYIPNRMRKFRAWKLLRKALKVFIRQGMTDEAAAVTAEISRLRPEGAVPQICAELLTILDPGPIWDLVDELRTVRMVERVDVAEKLRAAVKGPGILPSAVFPPP